MSERDISQGAQPDHHDHREYGMHEQYADEGTLNEGYGESEQMGAEQWSGERYNEQAAQVDSDMLDRDEPRVRATSDIDDMTGGMIPPEETPDDESSERNRQLDELQG